MKVMKTIANKVLFIHDGAVGFFGNVSDIDDEILHNENFKRFISHI